MKYKVTGADLASVADAIRTKGGTSSPLEFPDGFVEAIGNISGGGSTLITKSITENGTYNASSDNADGYSSVTVNVQGKFVTGTFTGASSEEASAKTITIPYAGTGYPISCIIYPTGGTAKSGSDFATLVQRYAEAYFSMVKVDMSATPDYSETAEKNNAFVVGSYKNSDSDATNYTGYVNRAVKIYNSGSATATYTTLVRFNSATSMSVYIASTSYGFPSDIEFTYEIVYSR